MIMEFVVGVATMFALVLIARFTYNYATIKPKNQKEAQMSERDKKIMARLQEHYNYLQAQGFEIVALMLQGSQNYNLDEYSEEYMSDVDSKAIVLPSFDDIVCGRSPYSSTLIMPNNEHIDTKDIRVMFEMLKKENISYIELLFTKYKIVNPKYEDLIEPIFFNSEKIANANVAQFARCIAGMSLEKKKALCHPYEGLKDKIDKYGFDGKQLSHAARLCYFLDLYMHEVPVEGCYNASSHRIELMNYKKQKTADGKAIMTKEEAVAEMERFDGITQAMKNAIVNSNVHTIDTSAYKLLDSVKVDILKRRFREEIR